MGGCQGSKQANVEMRDESSKSRSASAGPALDPADIGEAVQRLRRHPMFRDIFLDIFRSVGDIDQSGKIDSRHELFQLSIGLLYTLRLKKNKKGAEVDQLVSSAVDLVMFQHSDGIAWTMEQSMQWFLYTFVNGEDALRMCDKWDQAAMKREASQDLALRRKALRRLREIMAEITRGQLGYRVEIWRTSMAKASLDTTTVQINPLQEFANDTYEATGQELAALKAHKVFQDTFNELFTQADLDESGLIDGRDELFQLTISVLYKLKLSHVSISDMGDKVDKVFKEHPEFEWSHEQTQEWFVSNFVPPKAAHDLVQKWDEATPWFDKMTRKHAKAEMEDDDEKDDELAPAVGMVFV